MTTKNSKKILYTTLTSMAILALMTASISGTFINQAKAISVDATPIEKIPGPYVPPTPDYTSAQLDLIKSDAMKISGISSWSNNWKVNYVDFVGTTLPTPKWQKMMVHLYTAPTDTARKSCDIGWDAIVVVDLDTNKIVDSVYPTDITECHRAVVKLGDPDVNDQKVTASIIPAAEAIASVNGYSAATMDDILTGTNSIQGSIADIKTPTFSGTYTHMDGFVGQLVNLRMSPTAGVNYLQSGWVIAKAGCTVSCGDLVLPNTKVLVWGDSSVSPFNSDAHVFGYPSPPAWVNGQTVTAEVLCNGGTNYKIQAVYGANLLVHNTNVACTQKAYGSEIANSVFFENGNTVNSSNWSVDITSTVNGSNASEKLNGSWTQWQASSDKDKSCTGTVTTSAVMTGNIKLNGAATWSTLSSTPKGC